MIIFFTIFVIAGVSLAATLAHGTETGEWRYFFGIGLPAAVAAFAILTSLVPTEKEITRNGIRKESGIRYALGSTGNGPGDDGPVAYLENGDFVKIALNRITVSGDGENRAVRYEYRRKCLKFIDLGTFSTEYRLELTPETMEKVGIYCRLPDADLHSPVRGETEAAE